MKQEQRWERKALIAIRNPNRWEDTERKNLSNAVATVIRKPNPMILKRKFNLTKKQTTILDLFLQGMTQEDIGAQLGTGQTTIHKALWGNIDYQCDRARYGGIFKKIGKVVARENKIKEDLAVEKEKKARVKKIQKGLLFNEKGRTRAQRIKHQVVELKDMGLRIGEICEALDTNWHTVNRATELAE